MNEPKMTAEERVAKRRFYAEWNTRPNGNGPVVHEIDAIYIEAIVLRAEEHAAAAVAWVTKERDEARAEVARLRKAASQRHREDQRWVARQFASVAEQERRALAAKSLQLENLRQEYAALLSDYRAALKAADGGEVKHDQAT